ncbi:MAG: hypothetical protein E6G01_00515 [Actinobacteria bacterium]|nr:MAG: hypothetical protein E6G01_00515 [Actinomycetota bacterium]
MAALQRRLHSAPRDQDGCRRSRRGQGRRRGNCRPGSLTRSGTRLRGQGHRQGGRAHLEGHRRGRLADVLIGSVAQAVGAHSRRPVLVVHRGE